MTRLLLSAIAAALVCGCIGLNQPVQKLRYVIDPKVSIATQEASDRSLAVRPLESARPYKQNVVYREGPELGMYSSVEWSELPSDAATRALMDALESTHRFSDVGSAIDLSAPDLVLTGQLRRFDLVRDTEPWKAVCEIRLELRESLGRVLVWSETITTEEPLESPNIASLPRAMNDALANLIEQAVTQIVAE